MDENIRAIVEDEEAAAAAGTAAAEQEIDEIFTRQRMVQPSEGPQAGPNQPAGAGI